MKTRQDEWPFERVGYDAAVPPVSYAPAKPAAQPTAENPLRSVRRQELLGSLLSAGGLVWGAHTVTLGGGGIEQLMTTPGPLEVCALGVVNWLIAKWRRATRVR